ncbi:MAG: hypothetical protein H5U38_03735, partial [Calditrichaeota bacterium]|nr:hypothetical protein [Calditrichota bacterium]
MIYGPFDLSDATDAELSFYYWLQSENGYDYFFYGTSSDGAHFDGQWLDGSSGGWRSVTLDIGELSGYGHVYVAFAFDTDHSVELEGAYVDDVVLRKYVSAPGPPILTTPRNGATGVGIDTWFKWRKAARAAEYVVQVGRSSTLNPVEDEWVTEDTTLLVVDDLRALTTHYWRVGARNDPSLAPVWSPIWSFTTMGTPPVSIVKPTGYVLGYLTEGDEYYIDRAHVLGNIPDQLKNLLWILTANNDKGQTATDFLSFTLQRPAT